MYDYIIVGQGIAGSVLSYTLLKKGKKVFVIDRGNKGSSSAVAAGLYNPITGKKKNKTWLADKIFPFLDEFYKRMEQDIQESFFFEIPIYRTFSSIEEQNSWASGSLSDDLAFVNTSLPKGKYSHLVDDRLGGFETKSSGYVDVKKMLSAMEEYLITEGAYLRNDFKLDELKINEDRVTWMGKDAKRIIFCDGYHATENIFFKWLPFFPAKGEVLTVKIKDFKLESILNKKVFVLPVGNEIFKVGATFDWVLNTEVTEKGREELSGKLKELIQAPFEIINQEAGIRPAVKDRRPLIGLHPEFPSVGIFNGLGAKGISLAPYFAEEFYNYLENEGELDPAANIKRFYSLYYTSKE